MVNIRPAKISDAKNLLEIYRPYVENSPISFEYKTPSLIDFENRITNTLKTYPWLILEKEGEIAGYAYAAPYRSRCAYNWSVEATVYISHNFARQGFGKSLYERLFEILKKQGAVNVFAGITLPNESSIGLHEALGFSPIGIYKNVGFKFDKWWDVGWWQLSLQKPEKPATFINYSEF